jgi:hypothetical protein
MVGTTMNTLSVVLTIAMGTAMGNAIEIDFIVVAAHIGRGRGSR